MCTVTGGCCASSFRPRELIHLPLGADSSSGLGDRAPPHTEHCVRGWSPGVHRGCLQGIFQGRGVCQRQEGARQHGHSSGIVLTPLQLHRDWGHSTHAGAPGVAGAEPLLVLEPLLAPLRLSERHPPRVP